MSVIKIFFSLGLSLLGGLLVMEGFGFGAIGAYEQLPAVEEQVWVKDIEKIFIPSEQCKQCHDRHYEEWKGMRERTEDNKSFGRVDGALLHGNALKSPVFKTVLGLWLQTNPTQEQRTQCLACHAPAVKIFPQYTERIIQQVMAGSKHVKVEGIGCTSCHLINATGENQGSYPTFKLVPGLTMFGPYAGAKDNLVHHSEKAEIYDGANYCTSCHFSKVKDVAQAHLNGAILKDLVCQDCHMEQSTGSSTNKYGSLSRPIGRHWFQGLVTPGLMLSNRNVQAEWSSRLEVELIKAQGKIEGTVHIRNGSVTHMFPGGDPVLKQFLVEVIVKDSKGRIIGESLKKFGRSFEELLEGPIPQPLVNGGITRRIPFSISVPEDSSPELIEASVSYALIPKPGAKLKNGYLATLSDKKDIRKAEDIITSYSSFRLLTFRTMSLKTNLQQAKKS
ncbi:MAG: cytochrome c family protein [Nitrospirota bacterium]|nr:cytochrome c family protein [Nitrospirota bacterium]